MSGEAKGIFKVACTYVATIIGAGFASGQEIVQFFSSYQKGGFFGILLAGALFSIIGYVVLGKVYRERIMNYDEFIFPSVGWVTGWIIEIAVVMFMLSVFCVMVAGSGQIFMDRLSIPFNFSVAIMAAICTIALLGDIKGVVALSSFISPVLIAGITTVGFALIVLKEIPVLSFSTMYGKVTHNWLTSALIYVGYNSIISIVVLCSLLPILKTRKIAVVGGVLGGLALCLIALILNIAILAFRPVALNKELPVLEITAQYSWIFSNIYAVILWLAMFISAVTSGFCLIDRLNRRLRINRKLIALVVCALVIPLSNFGFSNLISNVYPVFGYIGLFIIIVALIQGIGKARPVSLNRRRQL